MYAGTLAGGGTAGVGVTLMVSVIGGMLDQDAADSLKTGKDENGNSVTTFDPNALINDQAAQSPGITNAYYEEYDGQRLAQNLEGDGTRVSDNTVGHKVHKKDKDGNLMYDEQGNPIYEMVIRRNDQLPGTTPLIKNIMMRTSPARISSPMKTPMKI